MKTLKKILKESVHRVLSPEDAAETLLNGNISYFKTWAKNAPKSELIESLDFYAHKSGKGYAQSSEYFKRLTEELTDPPKAKGQSIKKGETPKITGNIDEPATGYIGRRKENTGKQHAITAYDNQWESAKSKKEMKLKNLLKKKKKGKKVVKK
jgi:hypothetical protein